MRVALLILLAVLPIRAQAIGVTMKAWEGSDSKDFLGLRNHVAWDLTVTCPAGMVSFRRQDVAEVLTVAELGYIRTQDALDKAQKLDPRGLGGKVLDWGLKAGGAAMTGGGIVTVNPWLVAGGLTLSFGDGVKGVLQSVEVQTARYAGTILPENNVDIPCKDGRGGQFLVLTGPVKKPEPIKVAAARRINFGECSEGRPSEAFNGPECCEMRLGHPLSDPSDPVAILGEECIKARMDEVLSKQECVEVLMQHLPGGRHGEFHLPAGLDPNSCIAFTTIPPTTECAPVSQVAPTLGPIQLSTVAESIGNLQPPIVNQPTFIPPIDGVILPNACEPHSYQQALSCIEAWVDYWRGMLEAHPSAETEREYLAVLDVQHKAEKLIREHSAQVGAQQ